MSPKNNSLAGSKAPPNTFIILATGQSLNQADVDYVRGKASVFAVSNAYTMAPWADCLISHDSKWWQAHPEALKFEGRKFSRMKSPGTEKFLPPITNGCNSGLMAMELAKQHFGAELIILLGFDMHGTHYFGPHETKNGVALRNTNNKRFNIHLDQFRTWTGPEVINCTPGSALTRFTMAALRDTI